MREKGLGRQYILSYRVRLSWGNMENFKCVDYFQIQWFDPHNFQETLMTTGKIGRHTRDFDIDVKPCKDYVFQVGDLCDKDMI